MALGSYISEYPCTGVNPVLQAQPGGPQEHQVLLLSKLVVWHSTSSGARTTFRMFTRCERALC